MVSCLNRLNFFSFYLTFDDSDNDVYMHSLTFDIYLISVQCLTRRWHLFTLIASLLCNIAPNSKDDMQYPRNIFHQCLNCP